jgi:hypothetical protein
MVKERWDEKRRGRGKTEIEIRGAQVKRLPSFPEARLLY